MANKKENEVAGKSQDRNIKTTESQDNAVGITRKQSGFNERTPREVHDPEKENELNKKDSPNDLHDASPL